MRQERFIIYLFMDVEHLSNHQHTPDDGLAPSSTEYIACTAPTLSQGYSLTTPDVRDVKHSLAFVAKDFDEEMKARDR